MGDNLNFFQYLFKGNRKEIVSQESIMAFICSMILYGGLWYFGLLIRNFEFAVSLVLFIVICLVMKMTSDKVNEIQAKVEPLVAKYPAKKESLLSIAYSGVSALALNVLTLIICGISCIVYLLGQVNVLLAAELYLALFCLFYNVGLNVAIYKLMLLKVQ